MKSINKTSIRLEQNKDHGRMGTVTKIDTMILAGNCDREFRYKDMERNKAYNANRKWAEDRIQKERII